MKNNNYYQSDLNYEHNKGIIDNGLLNLQRSSIHNDNDDDDDDDYGGSSSNGGSGNDGLGVLFGYQETVKKGPKLNGNLFFDIIHRLLFHFFEIESIRMLIKNIKEEIQSIINVSIPTFLMQFSQMVLAFEDLMLVGNLNNSTYLAAAALGNSYTLCLSYACSGLVSALDTLISQAYGARQHKSIGVYLNRAILLSTLSCIPISFLYWFSGDIFILLGQDKRVSRLSGTYCRWLIIGLWPLVLQRTFSSFLVNQNNPSLPAIVSLISVFLNFFLAFFFIYSLGMGFHGAPIATSLCRVIQSIIMILFTYFSKTFKKSYSGIKGMKKTFDFKGMYVFIKLAIPGMIMIVLEIWIFELTTIPAGILGDEYLGGHSIVLNIYLLIFMIPLSIGIACNVQVGSHLGALMPGKARFTTFICLLLSLFITTTVCSLIIVFREFVSRIFTRDTRILEIVNSTIPFALCFLIFDAINVTLSGAIRGLGKQVFGTISNLLAYWILGLSVGSLLAFLVKWKIIGLWVGLALGAFIVSILSIIVLTFIIDWKKESEKAMSQAKEEQQQLIINN